ncbi:hypothetical protein ANN_08213 [Periplaneta americana]|uniref:DUF4817 domain-containing protein n=1 Tax=Periplaneta americana TaxID=6978 RepID=A0ABQ8T0S9_PERAM|nr:hypothetical protein ANN_08213 [Periplaneta americana]
MYYDVPKTILYNRYGPVFYPNFQKLKKITCVTVENMFPYKFPYPIQMIDSNYRFHLGLWITARNFECALFSTFCVNVKMQYTLNQRLFLAKQYWITNSITATQRAYQRDFGVRNPPKRNTILGLVNKLETTGSLVSEKGKHRSSRLPTVVVDILFSNTLAKSDQFCNEKTREPGLLLMTKTPLEIQEVSSADILISVVHYRRYVRFKFVEYGEVRYSPVIALQEEACRVCSSMLLKYSLSFMF